MHDLKALPNVEKHFVLLSYAISSQSHEPNSIEWPKISIFAIFGPKCDQKGPNLGPKMLLSAPWPPLVATYHCQLSQYAISSISNEPKSKKSTKTSFSKIAEKWLSLEAWWTSVKEKKIKIAKNHLFSRIERF
jgi:hypothetical protein